MEKYVDSLNKQAHARYLEKIAFIGKQDPYQIDEKEWSRDHSLFPELTYPDLVNYLIFHPSPFYTLKDFQNYKSLDAYDRFICGWVRDVGVYIYSASENPRKVIKARVMHSQKLSDPSLHPWIIIDDQSKIISAHCDCKAGLGESCSHVASVLFYIEATVRLREASTVTQAPAYWMLPTSRTSVNYSPLLGIDFTSSKTLKKQLDKKISQVQTLENLDLKIASHETTSVKKPTEINKSRIDLFFKAIKPDMPSCLSVNREYNTAYIPKSLQAKYPLVLTELFDDKCVGMDCEHILEHCQSLLPKIAVTEDEAYNVESETRDQADSKLWHRMRTGRITASRETAWNKYQRETAPNHTNWKSETCGLFLKSAYPHMGASPDGLVECDCCGRGCLEIKCSFCMRDENFKDSDEGIDSQHFKH
ncbi:uncharacterized protein [Haliotis cracherodii]|uniref:uncharacterized protein n=1 Tax=Haliotis cracherodii TaxID=6455 RepID=UPI0039EC4955